ncbi:MAG: RHS repeat-associated core domain-containing protein [Thermoplasmata archaeon]
MLKDVQKSPWDATYEPFGKATVTTATVTNNLRFPGQYYDAETGLHYNYYRYYWPETGRYISADPYAPPPKIQPQEIEEMMNGLLPKSEAMYKKILSQEISLLTPFDFHSYIYAFQNPLIFIDPYAYKGCKPPCPQPPPWIPKNPTAERCKEYYDKNIMKCPFCPGQARDMCLYRWKQWLEECLAGAAGNP